MPNDILLPQLVLNKMSREQFKEAKAGGAISPTEMYLVDDVENGSSGNDYIPTPSSASVGQTIRVSAVDANGKPTEWEAVDFPEGGGEKWRLIKRITLEEETAKIPAFTVDDNGNTFDLKAVRVTSPNIASGIYVSNDMHGRLWVGTRSGGETNQNVFTTNTFVEIGMTQNPSNYPFWGQVEYVFGAWHILTSNGSNGTRMNKFVSHKSETIQKLWLSTNHSGAFTYAAGVIIEFWGVDA